MTRVCLAIAIMLVLWASACRQGSGADEEVSEGTAANVSLAVTVAKVVRAPMRSEVTLLGNTVAMRRVTIRAPAAGRVQALTIQPGDSVRRGQVIARLENRETEAARSGLAIANELDREHAHAMDRALKRLASAPTVPVRAPDYGVVTQRLVSSGQMVNEFDSIAEVVDPRSIYVEAAAPIDITRLIKPGMAANIRSPLKPDVMFPGRVEAVSASFNQGGATVPVRIRFGNTRRIAQAGAAVEARVITQDVPDALVVPTSALFQDAANGTFYVFVLGRDSLAHRTSVTTGIHDSQRVQVTSGLEPGQEVITSGGYALSDGLPVRVIAPAAQ